MAKEIIFSDNARNRLFAGVEKLAMQLKLQWVHEEEMFYFKNLLELQQLQKMV